MKKVLAGFLFASLPISAALEPGMRYDFYQKNGQHVLNAELLAESESDYTVKLRYVSKPIKISKTNLAKKPQLTQGQHLSSAVENALLRQTVYAGYSMVLGPLNHIFGSGLYAGLGLDWYLFRRPVLGVQALSVQTNFAYYQNSPRFIGQFSLHVGAQFRLYRWQRANIILNLTPLVGASFIRLNGYTFNSEYFVPSGIVALEVRKHFHRISVGVMLYSNYLFDQTLFFSATGMGVSAQYPIGF